MLRKFSAQTKDYPWKSEGDKMMLHTSKRNEFKAKERNTGTFGQRGKKAQRKTDWWVVSGPRLLNWLRDSHMLKFFL